MFGLFSKGRVRQCQLYLEDSHVETHVCDSENSVKRDAGCFGTNIPSLDKHTHTTKGWWPAVTLVPWCLLCHGGWGQENDSPDTNCHATGKASSTNISTQCPAEPLFPIRTLSGDNNELLCTKTYYIFSKTGWKTDHPSPILSVCSVNSQILYGLGFCCQYRFKVC